MFMDAVCTEELLVILKIVRRGIIPILQIGVPVLLIVLGMLDLGKAVVAGKEDEIKKNQQMLVKRAISAVAVFLVATVVVLVFDIVASSSDSQDVQSKGWKDCWDQAKG